MSKQLDFAVDLAKTAGEVIRDNLHIGTKRKWKEDHTPVTAVDTKINALVLESIHREYPAHSILAEEGSDLGRSKEYVWVCDPLDGTFPFMHGIPVSTFTLALVRDGEPVLGVVYDPFMDRLFCAESGRGSTLNQTSIHTRKTATLSRESVGVVFWKGNETVFGPLVAKIAGAGATVYNLVSVAYMDALVASGELAAVVFPGQSAHDSAAVKILVEEAGGTFTSIAGGDQRYDQKVNGHIAACSEAIHKEILSFLSL